MQALKSAELTGFELYNLTEDIGETNDLSASQPEKLAELTAVMQAIYHDVRDESPIWPAWEWPRWESQRIEWPDYARPGRR